MIARTHVGDDGHLATVKGKSFTQQAAPGCFKYSSIHIGVHQDISGTARAAAIAIVNLTTVDVDTIGVGHAHAPLMGLEQVSGEANCGGFAVGASDGYDRNTAVVAIGEHVVNDRLAHIAAFAKRWADVHAQTRCCVDFNDAAVLLFKGFQDRFADHIDTANVHTHHLRSGYHASCNFCMHIIGHVRGSATCRQIGVVAKDDASTFFGNGVGFEVLQLQTANGDVVKFDFGERRGVAITAAWICIDFVNQLAHCKNTIAHNQRRFTASGSHQFVANHQQTIVAAWQKFFNQNFTVTCSCFVGLIEELALSDVDCDAFALVAILGFDHHGQANALCNGPGVF